MLQYGDPPVRRAVPLGLALLSASNPSIIVIDTLSKLSHDQDQEVATCAIVAMGIAAGGTNHSKVAGSLRSLAPYYAKEPGLLFAVRLAQGLVHAGKGLVTLSPYHPESSGGVCHPVALAGLLVALAYLTLLQFVRPYKRETINLLAIAAQFSLVCVYLGGAFVKVFAHPAAGAGGAAAAADAASSEDSSDDDTAVLRVVIIMVAFNFAVLTLYVSLAAYQFATRDALPQIRLVSSGQPPELRLRKGCKWHLFLSHVWSSRAACRNSDYNGACA